MAGNMSVALVNAGLEALMRFIGEMNFELSEVPSAIIAGSVVGACSLLGGLIGGRLGILVGGSIGYEINNTLLPRIRNVAQMLRELAIDHLQNLFDLLMRAIQNTVSAVQSRTENENLHLIDLLERFGSNSDVRMNIIDTLINYFNGVHGVTYRQVTLQ